MNAVAIVAALREEAEKHAEDRRVAEFGPGGGNPKAKAEDHLEWRAADEIERLREKVVRLIDIARLLRDSPGHVKRCSKWWEDQRKNGFESGFKCDCEDCQVLDADGELEDMD